MLPGIERNDPGRTVIVPRTTPRGRMRFLLPWLVFGVIAVAVVGGSTLWSVALRANRSTPDVSGSIDTGAAATDELASTTASATPTPTAATATAPETVIGGAVRSPAPRPRAVAPPATPVSRSVSVETSAAPVPMILPTIRPTALPRPLLCTGTEADSATCVGGAPTTRPRARTTKTKTTPQRTTAG